MDAPAQLMCPRCSVRPSRYNWFGEDLYERILCEECRRQKKEAWRQEMRGGLLTTFPPCD